MSDAHDGQPPPGDGLDELLAFVAESRAIDFSAYKRTSLTRRIAKRMGDVGADTYFDYRDMLEANSEEFRFLFDTVLINVTSFFRDPAAWEFLRSEVIPETVAQAAAEDELRVWSAGCSSGEEAYSLAIAFAEAMGVEQFRNRVKIYATDVDEDALRTARQGVYAAKALESLAPELVERYFEPTGGSYAFRPDLRRKVIYGRHDITHDAPISRLSILACRNTLMYFNAENQRQIMDRFHFALRDGGFLFLGKAEMLLSHAERFEATSMPHRIFRRRPGVHAYRPAATPVTLEAPRASEMMRQRQLRDIALDVDVLAHLVVDVNGVVTLTNNQLRAMFGVGSRDEGRPLRDLEISYRPVELRSLIEQAQGERRTVRLAAVERRLGPNETQFLDVQVQPLISDDGLVLGVDISFHDSSALIRAQEEARRASQDLETAYEELQSTNEELETTNEELQSSIEELETTNEELQSTNEELETTNEELQSSNEELETMNEELRARSGELDETAGYLESILGGIPYGLVVLDPALLVRSWNGRAEGMWGLRAEEVIGKPFFGLDFGLPTGELRDPVRACIRDGAVSEVPIASVNRLGRAITCLVTVTALGARHDGVVLIMEDRETA